MLPAKVQTIFEYSKLFCGFMRKGLLLCHLCLCVLLLMMGCTGDGVQMRQQLEKLEQQNRAGEQLLNDSLAEDLVEYFDKHGNANERMRAKYMLGRTYYHLGELPRALETYLEAADCADTTAADCDYKILSRIHAQSAVIYHSQIQPRSELTELRLAEYYAWKGKDTLQAIECFAQQANAFSFLQLQDSMIIVCEKASTLFKEIGRKDRASQIRSREISYLISNNEITKSKHYIKEYELYSNLFIKKDSIKSGHEIFYYIKGNHYLANNELDSAEYLFRKELRDGKDLNNQIAGSLGLQRLYQQKRNSDSIAKYASLSYKLNDSAYNLSEMQNIQKFQASYNYNHQQLLAEQNARKAEYSTMWLSFLVILLIILSILVYFLLQKYKADREKALAEYRLNLAKLEEAQSELLELREKNKDATALIEKRTVEVKELQNKIEKYKQRRDSYDTATLEDKIDNANIVKDLNSLLYMNPVQSATQSQIRELKNFINEQIPSFYDSLNSSQLLRPIEYEVCLLTRCHFKPASICKLLDRSDGYIANLRKGILLKVYGIKGSPKDLDERIMKIV